MLRQEREKLFLDRLIKHQDDSKEKKFYAIQRFDLLVISINGAGIYGVLELMKHLNDGEKLIPVSFWLLYPCFNFVFSIIINLMSQWTGYKANSFECDSAEFQIDEAKGDAIDQDKFKAVRSKVKFYNTMTNNLNVWSGIIMLFGIALLGTTILILAPKI